MNVANTTQSPEDQKKKEKQEKNRKDSKQRRDKIANLRKPYPHLTSAQASNVHIFVKYGNMTPEQGVSIAEKFHKNVSNIRNPDDMKQWLTDIINAMPIAAKLLEEMNEWKPLSDTENADVSASELDDYDLGKDKNDDLLSAADMQRLLNDENGTEEDIDYISGLNAENGTEEDPQVIVEAPGANVCAPNYFKLKL